jgi:carboxylesterase type B
MIIICVRDNSLRSYADVPEVMVKQGALRGFHSVTRKGRKIVSFLRVPYAAPPIAELRFKVKEGSVPLHEEILYQLEKTSCT